MLLVQIAKTVCVWIANNYQWVIGLFLQAFIAYHVFYLSKRLTVRDKLIYKDKIRKQLDEHLVEIETRGINRKMVLVNSRHVGNREKKNAEAYGEIKTTRSDGVEFFGFIDQDNKGENVYVVYLLPYENIEYVDLRGDDMDWLPQIICRFKGIKGTPWKEIRYYKNSSTYHKGNDPPDWKYSRVENYVKENSNN